jgi:hypothetical protein
MRRIIKIGIRHIEFDDLLRGRHEVVLCNDAIGLQDVTHDLQTFSPISRLMKLKYGLNRITEYRITLVYR